MTDIVLIQPPVEDFYFTYKRTIPYGLASIAASLQKNGFSVKIVDCLAVKKSKIIQIPTEMEYLLQYYGKSDISTFSLFHEFRHYGYSYEYAAKVVRDKNPFLVGISSLFTPYCYAAEKMAQVIKKFLPKCKIVMGGHHPTALPYEVMKCSAVDFILRGEAEASMPLLAQMLKNGGNLEDIPGIVLRKDNTLSITADSSNQLYISEPLWIKDISLIDPPAMDLVNHNFYSRSKLHNSTETAQQSTKQGSTVIVASRGCPMPCTYCSVGASSSHGRFRQRRVKDVIYELSLQIEKYNIGFIDFEDENLTLNRKWFLDLMEQMVKLYSNTVLYSSNKVDQQYSNGINSYAARRTIELRAMNGLYPPSLDEEMILAMKEAGFKTLNLSLGSTSSQQVQRFNRPDVKDSFEQVLSIAQKHDMECVSYLIAGAPEQSAEESLSDLIFLAQKRSLVGLSIFYPAPGSVDYERCRQRGLLPNSFSLMRSSALPINHTTTRLQSVTLLRLARVVNFMKALLKNGISLPEPELYEKKEISDMLLIDRRALGIKLLKWFLHDGILRGVSKDGSVFEHNVDLGLCTRFVKEIQSRDARLCVSTV